VNTTSPNLVLANGAVSSLILQAAGPSLQAECTDYVQKKPSLAVGEIAVTKGYNLSCKAIYHGSCIGWDNGAGPCEQSVRDLLKTVFHEAHRSRMTSIAIPAIGTGNLKIPHALVARMMYEEAKEFSSKNSNTALKDIRFVIYDKDLPTIAAFEAELASPAVLQNKKKSATLRGLAKRGHELESRHFEQERSGLENKESDQGWVITIGSVTLQVAQGDLTKETTDAIVNSTNETMKLANGNVSAAILRAGGSVIQDECNKIGKMVDGLAVTSAGHLPCKFVFHMAAHNKDKGWARGINRCLLEAEQLSISSISFPLLGTGNDIILVLANEQFLGSTV
jgi:poly [ADP-ribose] polymerase 10/14/15